MKFAPEMGEATTKENVKEMINTLHNSIAPWLRARFARTERGAALVEYALLVALIAVVCIVAIGVLGTEANDTFTDVGNSLSGVTATTVAGP